MKKDILRVFLPNLIKMFVTILSTFLIPKMLPIEEYGYIKLFQLYVSYIGISSLGYCDGVYIKYGGKSLEDISKKTLGDEQATLICWQLILSVLITIVAIYQQDYILIMFGLSFIPSALVKYFLTLFQAIGSFDNYAKVYNTHSILTIISDSICLFVLNIRSGYVFVFMTVVVNYLVSFIILITFCKKKNIKWGIFQRTLFIENVQSGFLLMLGNMAYTIFAGVDKWFVKLFEGMSQFSYYSFAAQLLSALNMFANPITYTLYSYFCKEKSEAFEYKMKRTMIAWLFFLLSGVFLLKIIVNNYLFKYTQAIPLFIILFYSQVFYLLNCSIYINLFKFYQKQRKYFSNLVIIIILSIIMNTILYFGIYKSSVSFAVGTLLCMIIWDILNLRSFSYLKLHNKDFAFFIVMSVLYFVANYVFKDFMGLVVYAFGYLLAVFVFMEDIVKSIWKSIEVKIVKK